MREVGERDVKGAKKTPNWIESNAVAATAAVPDNCECKEFHREWKSAAPKEQTKLKKNTQNKSRREKNVALKHKILIAFLLSFFYFLQLLRKREREGEKVNVEKAYAGNE